MTSRTLSSTSPRSSWLKPFVDHSILQELCLHGKETNRQILPSVLPQDGQGIPFPHILRARAHAYAHFFFTPSFQDGRPVYIQRLGKIDVNAINAITTQERQLRRFVLEYEKFLTERLPACSRAVGHPVETSCTILDLAGVGVASFYRVKDYVFQAAGIGQDRYPECMGKFYIINAPWAFSTVWSIVKPWLDEVTVAKIDIVSSGTVKEKLLAQIPAENLPAEFGGKCRCVGGCSLSDAGPWNPEVGQDGEA